MTYTITLTNTNDRPLWIRFIERNRPNLQVLPGDVLVIDLSSTKFLYPFQLVSLACLIEEFYTRGCTIEFQNCNSIAVCDHLQSIRFFDYWKPMFDRHDFTSLPKQTSFCLWQLESTRVNSYTIQAQEFFEKNYFSGMTVAPLITCLSEAFNNIIDHSNSKVSGYTLSQYFPKKCKIQMSVCDFGFGISRSVNNFLKDNKKPPLLDSEALKLALREGFTTQTHPRNRGFGLSNLQNAIQSTGGYLNILTNKAVMISLNSGVKRTYSGFNTFNGTLIDVELDTSKLDLKELDFIAEDLYF